jgi:DNA-directed RNA polymerase specialized sigma24 family protein
MPAFLCVIVRDVERELQSIPEGKRRAVMLAAMSTDNYAGMAARLKITLGTFKSRLSRGTAASSQEIYRFSSGLTMSVD